MIKINDDKDKLQSMYECCAEATSQGRVVPSRVRCLLQSPLGVLLVWLVGTSSGLKPATGCVYFGSTGTGFWYRLISDFVCNRSWSTFLELPCYSLYVVASTGPGCRWEEPICVQGVASS